MADASVDGARATVEAYYDALRDGDPLGPFFADGDDVVKFGVSERLVGAEAVREGLAAQTETTDDWHVESNDLRVSADGDAAWFADDVTMAWTDVERGVRYEFRTRWSGGLRRSDDGWRFVGMHVSTASDL